MAVSAAGEARQGPGQNASAHKKPRSKEYFLGWAEPCGVVCKVSRRNRRTRKYKQGWFFLSCGQVLFLLYLYGDFGLKCLNIGGSSSVGRAQRSQC